MSLKYNNKDYTLNLWGFAGLLPAVSVLLA